MWSRADLDVGRAPERAKRFVVASDEVEHGRDRRGRSEPAPQSRLARQLLPPRSGAQGNIGTVEQTLFVRGLTAPAGHTAWTGLTAGALKASRKLRVS